MCITSEDYARSFFANYVQSMRAINPVIYYTADTSTLKVILKLIQIYDSALGKDKVI